MRRQARTRSVPEPRVLVVDDEEHIRSALGRYLSLVGFRVQVAASGEEALRILGRMHQDVAVVDIRMPGMDGVEFVRLARQQHADLAIVYLTGYATLESAIAAVKAQAVDYLLKPASAESVANAVSVALEKRQSFAPRLEIDGERYMRVGALTLDRESREVRVEGAGSGATRIITLTPSEAALLACFMTHPKAVISCRELARVALQYEVDEKEAQAIVRPHVSRLRKKIEADPLCPASLRTVLGAGYGLWPRASGD